MVKQEKSYVSKEEFCKICGISLKTGYKLLKMKKIKYEKCCDRLLHYYKIPYSEIERYLTRKEDYLEVYKQNKSKIRAYYLKILETYPDCLESKDIRKITGYGKEAIRSWINSSKIIGIKVRGTYKVSKEDLADFLESKYYYCIRKKSKQHVMDFLSLNLIC